MGEYVPSPGTKMSDLPGMGGIYNTINFHSFAYAGNNPIKYTDPDGEIVVLALVAIPVGDWVVGVLIGVVMVGIMTTPNVYQSGAVRDSERNPIPIGNQRPNNDRLELDSLGRITNPGSGNGGNGGNGKPPIAEVIVGTGLGGIVTNEVLGIANNGPHYEAETASAYQQSTRSQQTQSVQNQQSTRSRQTQSVQNQQTARSQQAQPMQVGPGQNAVYSPDSLRRSGQNNVNTDNNQHRTTYPGLSF
jgi:hypothetical protein